MVLFYCLLDRHYHRTDKEWNEAFLVYFYGLPFKTVKLIGWPLPLRNKDSNNSPDIEFSERREMNILETFKQLQEPAKTMGFEINKTKHTCNKETTNRNTKT